MIRPYRVIKRESLESAEPREYHARQALRHLQLARQHAKWARAGFLLPRVDAAVSSARGAVRAAEGRACRAGSLGKKRNEGHNG